MTAAPQLPPAFAACLNLLFEASAKENPAAPGTFVEYTNAQVAEAINDKHGPNTITSEYIRRLRKGDIQSPSVRYASVLADFFQVPLDTFNAIGSETAAKVMAEAQRFVDTRRRTSEEPEPPNVAVLARAARRLSPAGQRRAARFVEQLEELEAMENNAQPPEPPSS
ncbi:hypothetical protein [Streptomyces sp. NPDC047315]|uniref:hypothetical protein n=1 Tax=Streptomyces sp. NPDC047315 TaxID=3155142 RepID=UPI0033F728AF